MAIPGTPAVRDMMYVLQMCGFTLRADMFTVYRNAIAAAPADIRVVLAQTDSLITMGKVHEAATLVAEGIILVNGDDKSMFLLWWESAICKMIDHRFQEAVAEFETALTKMCGPVEFFHMYGIALHNMGRFREAVAKFDKAIELMQMPPPSPMPTLPCVRLMEASLDMLHMMRNQSIVMHTACQNDPAFGKPW